MAGNDVILAEPPFLSIQGEGLNLGQPTIFVRFFGCNLRCNFCDSIYAVDKNQNKELYQVPIESVVNAITVKKCNNVTFTGGEPFLYLGQILKIMDILKCSNSNYIFNFETNGLISPKVYLKNTFYTISPKLHALNDEYINSINQWTGYGAVAATGYGKNNISFKFVYENKSTIEQIKSLIKQIPALTQFKIYLMPEGVSFDLKKYEECAEQCIENSFIMSPRLHVIIWGNKRGV